MAQKKEFRIMTPRGSVFTSRDENGSVTAKIEWAPGFAARKAESFSKAQQFVDSEWEGHTAWLSLMYMFICRHGSKKNTGYRR